MSRLISTPSMWKFRLDGERRRSALSAFLPVPDPVVLPVDLRAATGWCPVTDPLVVEELAHPPPCLPERMKAHAVAVAGWMMS